MKISLEWLNEYLPQAPSPEEAADALTNGGLPVEVIERVGDDVVIDVEVTSNRSDCLSYVGVARELGALLDRQSREVRAEARESATPASSAVGVSIDAPQLCPHYTARVIRGVKVGPSPAWMVRRLEAIGLRSINNVVDVTNYVLFEMGQPLHAFDYDHLRGRQVVVRTARAGEKLLSIDGHERTLAPDMLVIADAERPVALAGVMGGLESEVSERTTNVLLESARFDPLNVRKTARALAMKSDSSYRFERGIDPTLPERASLRAAQLILETAGGELLGGVVEAGSAGYSPKERTLRLEKLRRVLGIDIPADEAVAALRRLQFNPTLKGDAIHVTVPSWRLDVDIEVDLVEEVARVVGYGRIPMRDEISVRVSGEDPERRTRDELRSTLVSAGYFEAVTFSWIADALKDAFTPPEATGLPRAENAVRKADAHLRPSLLPGLLEAVRRNETAGTLGARLFEIGSTFWTDRSGKVDERRRLGLVGSADYREVRGAVEALLGRLNADRPVAIVPDHRPGYAPGACGRIEWAGQPIGYVGRVDRKVAEALGLRELPAAAELDMSALLAGAQHVPQLKPLPKFPAIRRDLSLVVGEEVQFGRIESLIRNLAPSQMEDLEYVTTYRGKPLEKGQKSVTVTLIFRSPTGTLTSEQVEPAVQRVVDAARSELGATLRA